MTVREAAKKLRQEPNTRYDLVGVALPSAWRYIVFSVFPLGLILVISFFWDFEPIPAIASASNAFNLVIGLAFLIGSLLTQWGWYCKRPTQAKKVRIEMRGLWFLMAGFGGIAGLGLIFLGQATEIWLTNDGAPTPQVGAFTLLISMGAAAGCLTRYLSLGRGYPRLVAPVTETTDKEETDGLEQPDSAGEHA